MLKSWMLIGLTLLAVGCLACSTDKGESDVGGDVGMPDGAGQPDEMEPSDAAAPFPEPLAAHLRKAMDEYLAFSGDPGVSVAVQLPGGATFVEAAGAADMVAGTPMTTLTAFRVGSNTKPYISTLIMMLVDEGLMGLDDPLIKYVPDYPQWGDITIRMLLGMQSGIPDYLVSEAFMMAAVFTPDILTTPKVLLDFVKDTELLFEPGTDSLYTNTNYILVGLVIENVTGLPAHDALEQWILEPLGLDDTYLDVVDEPKENLAHGYLDLAIVGFYFGLGADAVALFPKSWFMEDYLVDAIYLFPPMFAWTDGGLVTTPADAMEFMHALLTGELVSDESLAQMQLTTICPILGTPVDYGLGLSTAEGHFGTRWGHGGLNFGYEANTIYFPERDVTISHMHNYLPEQSYRLEDDILAILAEESTELPDPACLVPEEMFGAEEGDVVEFRFKGPIEPEGTSNPAPGTTLVIGELDGNRVALYGYGTSVLEFAQDGEERVNITSAAPSLTEGVDLRVATISIARSLLEGADGVVDPQLPEGLVVLVMEGQQVADSLEPEKLCVVAVPDLARTAHLSLCGGPDYKAVPGELLRVFGVAPVTRSADSVEVFLAALGMSKCSCADGKGGFVDCPE